MSNQTTGPRDIVEGGPERPPNGQDRPDTGGGRDAARPDEAKDEKTGQRKDAPHQRDDVTYQPESGQLGAD